MNGMSIGGRPTMSPLTMEPRVPKMAFVSEIVSPPARMLSARPTTTSFALSVTTRSEKVAAITTAASTPHRSPPSAEPVHIEPSTPKKAPTSI